ncbi:MAG: SGNH/GDSL hydrolase family protein [Rubripirellula sp.]
MFCSDESNDALAESILPAVAPFFLQLPAPRIIMRVVTCCCLLASFLVNAKADEPLLQPNDRVAILGGTFVERMQGAGSFEAELQCRRPDWKLSFRNLGWSGDDVHGVARKRFDGPEDGFQRLLRDVETADPSVVLVAYGSAEASDGDPAVTKFETGLERLVDELQKQKRRIILLTPVAMPGFRVTGYDQSISECRGIIQRVGAEHKVPVVTLDWVPDDNELTEDRLLPNEEGYAALADAAAESLVGGSPCEESHESVRRRVSEKNQLFFHRYRPQNETYLFLFRKHEQGNNAVEIPQFDPLIRAADEAIWEAAAH